MTSSRTLSRRAKSQYRVGGKFAKRPAPAAPVFGPFNAEANAKALARAIGNGDFATVKAKLSAFLGKVQATTPLEQVIVAMLNEYCGQ